VSSGPDDVIDAGLVDSVRTDGYAVIRLDPLMSPVDAEHYLQRQLSSVGQPIVVFRDSGIWRQIGVRLDKHPNRSEGVGSSPLHMDFVNAANPPDYVCLYCVRDDPLGGGSTVLAPIDASKNLARRHRKLLQRRVYRDGRVIDLENVGYDINPFRVIDDDSLWRFRYTCNLLKAERDSGVVAALRSLDHELMASMRVVRLEPGHAILFDQHRWVHGKTPLGADQENVKENHRRLLLQAFCRDPANKGTL
jgi:Taurine catabolism dioxygenase TauD, TfdA family